MEAGRPGRDLIASHLGQLFMVCVLCCFCSEFSDVRRVSSTVGLTLVSKRGSSIIALWNMPWFPIVCVLCCFCVEFSAVRRVSSTVGFVFCVAFLSSFPLSVVCLVQLV